MAIITIITAWAIMGYFFIKKIETPTYNVVEHKESYEVRQYEPIIIAYVEVEGTYRESIRQGFRLIADYIFGNNSTQEQIAMTAPVTEQQESQKIAMTAPVMAQEYEMGRHIISFIMPSKYTIETLPIPNNDQVKLQQEPSKKYAVMAFSWFSINTRVANKKKEFVDILIRDELEIISEPKYAGYNPPLTIPFMQRHEILIEVK